MLSLEVVGMTVASRVMKTPPVVEWDKLPLMLDETKAAAVLGVSVSFLRTSRCEGCKKPTLETLNDEENAPPFVKLGGRVKYPTGDLQEWADSLTRRRVI
jgi:predicted DNA-binding transcriptional regulator AlpA